MNPKMKRELSTKNKYYIPKNRYYELRYFCKQYKDWKNEAEALCSVGGSIVELSPGVASVSSDPVSRTAEKRINLLRKINAVERACKATDRQLYNYILAAVTADMSYDEALARYEIPCCRDTFYDRYRKFFYILDSILG